MKLKDLLEQGSNVTVSISLQDLRDFLLDLSPDGIKPASAEPEFLHRKDVVKMLQIDPSTL